MSSVDSELQALERDMDADQRLWLIERSPVGIWGVAIVRDLPPEKWKPGPDGKIGDADKFQTFVYRRHENLARAIYDARKEVVEFNMKKREDATKR